MYSVRPVSRSAGSTVHSQKQSIGSPGCQLSLDVPTVIVKVLPDAASRRWGLPANRLGFCVDKDVYLLMPGYLPSLSSKLCPFGSCWGMH